MSFAHTFLVLFIAFAVQFAFIFGVKLLRTEGSLTLSSFLEY